MHVRAHVNSDMPRLVRVRQRPVTTAASEGRDAPSAACDVLGQNSGVLFPSSRSAQAALNVILPQRE